MGTKKCVKIIWGIVCVLAIFGAVPVLLYELFVKKVQPHIIAWEVAGIFVVLSIPISLFGIFLHVNNWTNPNEQRYVIRILFMSPIYAVDAWLALRWKDQAIYFDTMREMYEAFTIYSFSMYLLYTVQRLQGHPDLEGIESELDTKLREKPMHHVPPCCCLPKWETGKEFLSKFKWGVVSYSIIRVLLGLVAFVAEYLGKFGEGDLSPHTTYFWVTVINNFSQLWAMYCLIQFYHVYAEELSPVKPFPKFLCIKLVVFFSFWQGILIAFLVKINVIKANADWTVYDISDVSTGLQDFIICIEMFIAALGHVYAFPHDQYRLDQKPDLSWGQKLRHMIDIRDVHDDVIEHVEGVYQGVATGVVETASKTKKLLKNQHAGSANIDHKGEEKKLLNQTPESSECEEDESQKDESQKDESQKDEFVRIQA